MITRHHSSITLWLCDITAVSLCDYATSQQYHFVILRHHSSITLWLCDITALSLCDLRYHSSITLWFYDITAVSLCDYATSQQYYFVIKRYHSSITLWFCDITAVSLFDYATSQHYHFVICGITAVSLCDYATSQQYHFVILRHHSSITLWLCDITAVSLCDFRTPIGLILKELSDWNKIKYLNLNIFRTRWCKPLTFKTQIIWSNRIHSLKYLRYATFGSKDTVTRKSEFVAKTQFL